MDSQTPLLENSIWADPDDLRTSFTLALSKMYKAEVPLYGDLVDIVSQVNHTSPISDSVVKALRYGGDSGAGNESSRLDIERHGAIRLGTAQELRTMRSVFAVFGLHPVGYYDLSEAGLPMHATCFRPISPSSLNRNPCRVFTSVLRPELIGDIKARTLAEKVLAQRYIFTDELIRLLRTAKVQNGKLTAAQGEIFIREALNTFRWQGSAIVTREEYEKLKAEHPVLADIVCFGTPHINHLTPRTLDITKVQESMRLQGIQAKHRIEGPPARTCPILLRQTSFLAVEERVDFISSLDNVPAGGDETCSHRARFGEVEERGAAVTPAGRSLYDRLIEETMAGILEESSEDRNSGKSYEEILRDTFRGFPDDWNQLQRLGLVYFYYHCSQSDEKLSSLTIRRNDGTVSLQELIEKGFIEAVPVTYEDFLPLSAAGIFQSNLSHGDIVTTSSRPDRDGLEKALETRIMEPDDLYSEAVKESIFKCSTQLQIKIVN